MLFNSFNFALFVSIVFLLYWFVINKNLKLQNLLILVASYFFYGTWDWRFLSLIIFSSTVDFFLGLRIYNAEKPLHRTIYLVMSLIANLGLLAYFKYANFFLDSLVDFMSLLGFQTNFSTISVILPVGISFYTFQTLSYTIDIFRKKLQPTKDVISFFAFVSFFPQLVAGPIERASRLLPQFQTKRNFNYDKAVDGMRQIVWGLFKKVVIADTCANYVNDIFANYTSYEGSVLFLGAVYFAVQIYCDFSGYSDIAIGTARLFGFELMQNFAFPYFARNIAEFWRRWHISLSTWFRDYLFIPLGGNRVKMSRRIFNIIVVFTVSGFWHGANWTFIIWGFLHGLYYITLMLLNGHTTNKDGIVAQDKLFPTLKEFLQMGVTFFIVTIAWVFFRAENYSHAIGYLNGVFDSSLFSFPKLARGGLIYIAFLFLVEWFNRKEPHPLIFDKYPVLVRIPVYYFFIITIIIFHSNQNTPFIYFQF